MQLVINSMFSVVFKTGPFKKPLPHNKGRGHSGLLSAFPCGWIHTLPS